MSEMKKEPGAEGSIPAAVALHVGSSSTSSASNNRNPADAPEEKATRRRSLSQSGDTEEMLSKRRKELFGDCALIEIIHLHDCLRGALKALETDVNELASVVLQNRDDDDDDDEAKNVNLNNNNNHPSRTTMMNATTPAPSDLERRVAGRFKVIWSVFRAHSSAEDEFIWPALQSKTQGQITNAERSCGCSSATTCCNPNNINTEDPAMASNNKSEGGGGGAEDVIEQEEYVEDHADEERMFKEMDSLLAKLREVLVHEKQPRLSAVVGSAISTVRTLCDRTQKLSQHLMAHLEKEEMQCMPLVVKHMSKSEIHELVGNIMGKRSADTIAQIMTMAVQNLDDEDREEMVKYMKQSMAGTFFDRWLFMSGWMSGDDSSFGAAVPAAAAAAAPSSTTSAGATASGGDKKRPASQEMGADENQAKRLSKGGGGGNSSVVAEEKSRDEEGATAGSAATTQQPPHPPIGSVQTTSQAELEKLIRAIASNPALTPEQKNTTIQGLRDSVWKSNQREKSRCIDEEPTVVVNQSNHVGPSFPSTSTDPYSSLLLAATAPSSSSRTRRETPPSKYYKKTAEGKIEMIWDYSPNPNASSPTRQLPMNSGVPLFSAAELAPTYHDGAAGAVLGCPHYSRSCKLRHPKSGRLYSCRLCCEQQRELPMRDQDEPLDRYEVKEVMCMKCNTLQPAEDRCINQECESSGKPFAKYFCRICHLYDDGSRPIFHCPYCNTCRLGLGLGIDFRHCMRCNACVSLADDDHHCIPQKLQGDCPICHDRLFQSTEPLRGLKCGHVMHLSCFTAYRRGHAYTCPLCMRSMEDMSDYFAMLDTAKRMQPMPTAYLSTLSNIYCQDCGRTGQTQYHFVGQKCPHCGSYNTREMGRVAATSANTSGNNN